MSQYNQYGNYYDNAGSQAHQPAGYTYQGYPGGYANQQYNSDAPAQTDSSTNYAAAALRSLSNQDNDQNSNRTTSTGHYNHQSWYSSNETSNTFDGSQCLPLGHSQSKQSPMYANTQQSGSYRASGVEQNRNGSPTLAAPPMLRIESHQTTSKNLSYRNQYEHPTQASTQSQDSSYQAAPSQSQDHARSAMQSSGLHFPSALVSNDRRQSSSVEPPAHTVDPSQVYDNPAEMQRQAHIEAERRRKVEAEQAAKVAKELRLAAELQKRQGEADHELEERRKFEDEAAAQKIAYGKKLEERRKAKQDQKAKSDAKNATQTGAAASATQQGIVGSVDDVEVQMRQMFQKMRELNQKNPAMLAKLWEEERNMHAATGASPLAKPVSPETTGRQMPKLQQAKVTASADLPAAATKPSLQSTQPHAKAQTTTSATTQVHMVKQLPAQANATLWPPYKKDHLAEATATWLNSLPQNIGKSTQPLTIRNVLDANPSYVQLCESLEALGVKFERSMLARQLLDTVQGGSKAQADPKALTSLGSVRDAAVHTSMSLRAGTDEAQRLERQSQLSTNGLANQNAKPMTAVYDTPRSLSDAARDVNPKRKTVQQPHYAPRPHPQTAAHFEPVSGSVPASTRPPEDQIEVQADELAKLPIDKEGAARKRTFGDLVDLTAIESDDESPLKKILQLSVLNYAVPQQNPWSSSQRLNEAHTYHGQNTARLDLGSGAAQPLHSSTQAQPVSSWTSASRLSAHQIASTNAVSVPPKTEGPTNEQIQQRRMKGKMLVEPLMRDRVARRSAYNTATIARDVLLATGRHPDMRGLNHHLNGMQKLLGTHGGDYDTGGGSRYDLATIRWDIIDPAPGKQPGAASPGAAVQNGASRSTAQLKAVVDESADELSFAITAPVSHSMDTHKPSVTQEGGLDHQSLHVKRRRGRPTSSVASGHNDLTNSLGSMPTTPPASTSRCATNLHAPSTSSPSLAAMVSNGRPVGYAAFREIGPDGRPIKKKGRPFGWKKSIHSREAQGFVPTYAPKKHERIPKPQIDTVVEPRWSDFVCKWDHCGAKLMNLDTLKKHLVKIHAPIFTRGNGYSCSWRHCVHDEPDLHDITTWLGHIDREHLEPLAWKLGDGPKGVTSSGDLMQSAANAPYLLDGAGRIITPIISPPRASPNEEAVTTIPPNLATRQISRPPVHGADRANLTVDLMELEAYKLAIGPTMDREGCMLASRERRDTFLGDEDFERVVHEKESNDGR